MKKVLLVVALLLLATPVFAADVTITATPGSFSGQYCPVTIRYTGAAEANSIRGFALVLTTDNGMVLDNIRDFNRGESTRPGGGFGIFPGKFRDFINPASPNWVDTNYNPLAPWNDLNSLSSNDNPKMVVELGTLFVEPNSPGTSGTLFTVDVNKETSSDCNLCIAVDATRGGVVKKDATAATVTLPGTYIAGKGNCITITAGPPPSIVPNVLTLNRVTARANIVAAGFVVAEVNVAPTAAGQLRTIIAQNPVGGTSAPAGSTVTINAVSYPVKDSAPVTLYANWVARNRPACWAYPRQCRGNADGKKQISYWVGSNNLAILKLAFNKAESVFTAGAASGTTSLICASFDHKKQISYWVGSNNLGVLKKYFNKAESVTPLCGSVGTVIPSADANYWYYCTPTGVSCPTGQTCAPAGVCPNTP